MLQARGDRLVLGRDVTPYDVNTPLFMDHALKLRTIWMPPGAGATFASHARYDLPAGTVLSKTFFYPEHGGIARAEPGWDGDVHGLDLARVRLVETRLLVRQSSGWEALPYVWRGDDAYLSVGGAIDRFDLAVDDATAPLDYIVPTRNECASCHATQATRQLLPLGIKTRQLNRGYHGADANQLDAWQDHGLLTGLPRDASGWPSNADWRLGEASPEHLARSYLDANCGHCHNPLSVIDTTGLWLDYEPPPAAAHGGLQTAHRGGTGHGRTGFLHRARAARSLDPDVPHGGDAPIGAHAGAWPHARRPTRRRCRGTVDRIAPRNLRLTRASAARHAQPASVRERAPKLDRSREIRDDAVRRTASTRENTT